MKRRLFAAAFLVALTIVAGLAVAAIWTESNTTMSGHLGGMAVALACYFVFLVLGLAAIWDFVD